MTAPPSNSRPMFPAARPGPHRPAADQPTALVPAADTVTLEEDAEPRLSLSVTQVLASTGAAVTAALIGSRLGVAGTLIGAALASVVSVVGGALLGHSILMTRKQVKRAVLQVRGVEDPHRLASAQAQNADDLTVVIRAVTRDDLDRATRTGRPGPTRSESGRPRSTRRRIGAGLLVGLAATAAIFAGSLAAVTLVETIKGSPVSGGDVGGLSILGGNGGAGATDPGRVTATTTAEATVSTVTRTVTSGPTSSSARSTADSSGAPSSSTPSSSTPSTSAPSTASSSPVPSAPAAANRSVSPTAATTP